MWVWIVSLPIIVLNAARTDVNINILDYIGWSLWGIGFFCEVLADQTKYLFNSNPDNKGKLLSTGIWSLSRHPNYFGEIMCWIGLSLSSIAVASANGMWGYISLVSPVFTFFLLVFISGIPLAEQRYDQRFKNKEFYHEYKESTSPLIPLPPQCYRAIPLSLKCLCCCEFPFFSNGHGEALQDV